MRSWRDLTVDSMQQSNTKHQQSHQYKSNAMLSIVAKDDDNTSVTVRFQFLQNISCTSLQWSMSIKTDAECFNRAI